MLITLVCKEKLHSIKLPDKCNGKYWFIDYEKPISGNRILSVEADENANEWIVKSTLTVTLYDKSQRKAEQLALHNGDIYFVRFGAVKDNSGFLIVEDGGNSSTIYTKYRVKTDGEIRIGRSRQNSHIVINNPFVSGFHGVLSCSKRTWKIFENTDTNGIYVNGKRIFGSRQLQYGDAVYIFGVKIVVGAGFIAINNPNGNVALDKSVFEICEIDDYTDDSKAVETEETYYFRSPRFIRDTTPLELKVDMPPQQERGDDTPIILTLAPSMVMGVASFSTGIFTLINAVNSGGSIVNTMPTLMMSVSMLIGMIVFPFIMKKREGKSRKKKENLRKEKYLKYLQTLKNEVARHKRQQEEILRENNPDIMEKIRQTDFWDTGLWSKSREQADYLYIRLGLGNAAMKENIKFPEERFTLDDDEMRRELFAFQAEEKLLMDVPVGIDLKSELCVGIAGAGKSVMNVLNNMIMQLSLLHGYDEVKIVCICEDKDFRQLEYMKAFGHVWDNNGIERFIACNEDEVRELSVRMNTIIQKQREQERPDAPYYIILAADRALANKATFLGNIDYEKDSKFRVIYCYDDEKELPRECAVIVKLDVSKGLIYGRNIDNYNGISFVQDRVTVSECAKAAEKMVKIKLNIREGNYNLPKVLSFMDLYEVGKAEHLNIMHRWSSNNPIASLKAPVGLDTNGDLLYLDLHEKLHGPHGLIAGMTGSGKSEFIITYILSMAVNYHPDEVAFVLIDYKGGGLAAAFDNPQFRLPHLAGTITNLDADSTYRCILAINSELKRRQRVFNEVKQKYNEGTMDIYKYQKMYRARQVEQPLPHLFIIADEFAELKSQQPDFMSELISTARIGRSLGVHLILATQKPSGVVSEQIWANSRFKVCLKVQDKGDSMEMLKRSEAAELSDVGRFYLQVGYNELFMMGQSAWCGANYLDFDTYVKNQNMDVEVIDRLGNVCDRMKYKEDKTAKDRGEQIVRILQYLAELTKTEKIQERQLWLPELPEKVYLHELMEQYETVDISRLKAVCGVLDDPYTQGRRLLTVNFEEEGNAVVYGNAGSGANLFVETVLFSMCSMYSPKELNIYVMDFENETMKRFLKLPQIVDVITEGNDEKIENSFSMLQREIKRRKELLAEYGGDMNQYNAANKDKLAKLVIVIYNYPHFIESYEKYEELNIALTRDCVRYGIYYLITANSASAVRYRTAQNFSRKFVLKLNDAGDYTSILESTGGMKPGKYCGRGLIKDKKVYSFQTAYIAEDEKDFGAAIDKLAKEAEERYGITKANVIPCMPKVVSAEKLLDGAKPTLESIVIGMTYDDCASVALNMKKDFVLGVFAEEVRNSLAFTAALIRECLMLEKTKVIVFNADDGLRQLISSYDMPENGEQGASLKLVQEDMETQINQLWDMALTRNNEYKSGNIEGVDMQPVIYVFNRFSELKKAVGEEAGKDINRLMTRVEDFWNIAFIITDSKEEVSSYSFERWYEKRVMKNCVWLGNGIKRFKEKVSVNDHEELKNELPPYSAYYFKDGSYKTMKFIVPDTGEGGEAYE